MSQSHVEPGNYRNPSDDAWWRRALDATGATMQLRAFEQDGRDVPWSDAVMNASAAAAMRWRASSNGRWADLPKGPLGDLSEAGYTDVIRFGSSPRCSSARMVCIPELRRAPERRCDGVALAL